MAVGAGTLEFSQSLILIKSVQKATSQYGGKQNVLERAVDGEWEVWVGLTGFLTNVSDRGEAGGVSRSKDSPHACKLVLKTENDQD